MKKFALMMAASALGTAAIADTHNPAYNGFYLGLQMGPNITTGKSRTALSDNGPVVANGFSKTGRTDFGRMGFAGGLFGGYGMTFSGNGYLGLEAYFNFDSTKANVVNDTSVTSGAGNSDVVNSALFGSQLGKLRLKRSFYYGLRAHVGYLFTKETMGYVILGIEGGKWKLSSWGTRENDGSLGNNFNKSKTRVAFVPGLGVRHALNKNVFLKMEWTVSFNPKLSRSIAGVNGANNTSFAARTVTAKSIMQNTVMFGVGYKF